jgi:hypothetical protein
LSTDVSEVRAASIIKDAVRSSETSVDNYFTRQYIPEDNSEHNKLWFSVAGILPTSDPHEATLTSVRRLKLRLETLTDTNEKITCDVFGVEKVLERI